MIIVMDAPPPPAQDSAAAAEPNKDEATTASAKMFRFPWKNHSPTLVQLCATNPKMTVDQLHCAFKLAITSAGYQGTMVGLKAFQNRISETKVLAKELKQLNDMMLQSSELNDSSALSAARQRIASIYKTAHVEKSDQGQEFLLQFGEHCTEKAAFSVAKKERRKLRETKRARRNGSAGAIGASPKFPRHDATLDILCAPTSQCQRLDIIEKDLANYQSTLATQFELVRALTTKIDHLMKYLAQPPLLDTALSAPAGAAAQRI